MQVVLFVLPWRLRRPLLRRLFGYHIHPTARIGRSIVAVSELEMGPAARIGDLNLVRGLDRLAMGPDSVIGRGNWITAIPRGSEHLAHEGDRRPELLIGTCSGLSSRHLLDCSNTVRIGDYSGLVGYASQLITHQIDMRNARQSTQPITIGDFCMVGTRSILLGGAVLPDRSALGAGSMLRSVFTEQQVIYSGVPAQRTDARIPDNAAFFRPEMRGGTRRLRHTVP